MALVMEKDKNLEVIFDDEIQMMLFVTGVQIFINQSHAKNETIIERKQALLRSLWAESDINADGKLDMKEI